MKKISRFLFLFLLIFLCSSCGSKSVKSISYSELNEMIENKETFFFVVIKDGCPYCEKFIPKVEEVLDEYGIEGYTLNYSDLSEEDDEKFFNEYGINSTPTTVFIKNGKEISILQRIEGNVSKDKLIEKLKKNNYIK